jgi:hypothetical protein
MHVRVCVHLCVYVCVPAVVVIAQPQAVRLWSLSCERPPSEGCGVPVDTF